MNAGTAVAAATLAAGLATALVQQGRRWCRRRRLLALVERVTRAHARQLAVKRDQLVVDDGYGNRQVGDWIKHANYFVDHVVLRDAAAGGLSPDEAAQGTRLRRQVLRRFLAVLQHYEDHGREHVQKGILSGQCYETLCQTLLQRAGWAVSPTPMTGDQGADLIADRGGQRLVVQCKFHARPIGNKAVQEACAALRFHAGDQAAVVSNQTFTRAARDLARANGVLLLHHDQLQDLAVRAI